MKIFNFLSILILFSSCGVAQNKNDDNTIYKVGRKFFFETKYANPQGAITKTDKLTLEVTDKLYPAKIQTHIVWTQTHISKNDTIITKETTGVEDSKERFFLHPPRRGDMYILSFANFPSIRINDIQNPNATSTSKGHIAMAKKINNTLITNVKTTSKYLGKTTIDIPYQKNISVHYLEADAVSEIGTIIGKYYFNEQLGFVKLDYTLPDSNTITIELTKTNF